MRLSLTSRLVLSSLVLLLGSAPSAQADYITGQLHNINGQGLDGGILRPGAPVTINLGNGLSPSVAYYPGAVNWTVKTPPAGKPNASWVPPVGGSFATFCIELPQEIHPGPIYTFQLTALANAPRPGTAPTQASPPTPGMGTIKANAIEELWGQDFNAHWLTDNPPTAADNTGAAAFQLAIWKIEYDWGTANFDNFAAGNFKASGNSAVIALAKTWVDAVHNNPTAATPANLIALTDPNLQDQVTEIPGGINPHLLSTPVPPSFYLAAMGAFTLLLVIRWRPALAGVQG